MSTCAEFGDQLKATNVIMQVSQLFSVQQFTELTSHLVRKFIVDQRNVWLRGVFVVSALIYVLVFVNLPTFLFAGAGHDDGLFISHAYSIASGHWLGPYSQMTLAKGPGYPLFLALISLFAIPVSLAHSLLYVFSIWLLAFATEKISRSTLLSLAVFEVLLWHFGPHSMRVIRDAIVTPQILIVFSFLLLCLFVSTRHEMLYASLAGLTFGWFWMTREDGVVVVPALLVLWACSLHKSYNGGFRSIKRPLKKAAVFLSSAGMVLAVVATTNLIEYRTFAIVDFGGAFESALQSLESVKPDVFVPYEGVAKSSREKVYKISPTFARLQRLLEGPGSPVEGWKQPSCSFYPKVCGDYASGWFMWALRDAVALDGDYSSAPAAARFYHNVHNDISRACNSGVIACYHNPLPYMPHVDNSQLLRAEPLAKTALLELSFVQPPPQTDVNSIGTVDQIEAAAAFLYVPNHTPPPPRPALMINHRVEHFATKTRASIIRLYSKALPILLLAGFCSVVIVAIWYAYDRAYSPGFAIACAAWLAVACRLGILILVDMSSFPAMFPLYIAYAYPIACYASLLSIFLAVHILADAFRKLKVHSFSFSVPSRLAAPLTRAFFYR